MTRLIRLASQFDHHEDFAFTRISWQLTTGPLCCFTVSRRSLLGHLLKSRRVPNLLRHSCAPKKRDRERGRRGLRRRTQFHWLNIAVSVSSIKPVNYNLPEGDRVRRGIEEYILVLRGDLHCLPSCVTEETICGRVSCCCCFCYCEGLRTTSRRDEHEKQRPSLS